MSTTMNSYNGTGTTLGGYIDSILTTNGEIGDVPAATTSLVLDHVELQGFHNRNGSQRNRPRLALPDTCGGQRRQLQFCPGLARRRPPVRSRWRHRPDAGRRQTPQALFTTAQIQPIIDWIDAGCQNPGGS